MEPSYLAEQKLRKLGNSFLTDKAIDAIYLANPYASRISNPNKYVVCFLLSNSVMWDDNFILNWYKLVEDAISPSPFQAIIINNQTLEGQYHIIKDTLCVFYKEKENLIQYEKKIIDIYLEQQSREKEFKLKGEMSRSEYRRHLKLKKEQAKIKGWIKGIIFFILPFFAAIVFIGVYTKNETLLIFVFGMMIITIIGALWPLGLSEIMSGIWGKAIMGSYSEAGGSGDNERKE